MIRRVQLRFYGMRLNCVVFGWKEVLVLFCVYDGCIWLLVVFGNELGSARAFEVLVHFRGCKGGVSMYIIRFSTLLVSL